MSDRETSVSHLTHKANEGLSPAVLVMTHHSEWPYRAWSDGTPMLMVPPSSPAPFPLQVTSLYFWNWTNSMGSDSRIIQSFSSMGIPPDLTDSSGFSSFIFCSLQELSGEETLHGRCAFIIGFKCRHCIPAQKVQLYPEFSNPPSARMFLISTAVEIPAWLPSWRWSPSHPRWWAPGLKGGINGRSVPPASSQLPVTYPELGSIPSGIRIPSFQPGTVLSSSHCVSIRGTCHDNGCGFL